MYPGLAQVCLGLDLPRLGFFCSSRRYVDDEIYTREEREDENERERFRSIPDGPKP